MTQSTYFNQVKNVLKVLQGYTKAIRFLLVMFLTLTVTTNAWGATTTYTFTSKSWADNSNGWTSGKDGNALTSGQGVQVTTGVSGANATTKNSFTNISSITVQYCTNSSKGKGSISIQVGSNTAKTFSVSAPGSGGTTLKKQTFTFNPNETGKVKISVTCSTNSIYIYSVTITTADAVTCTTNPTVSAGSHSNITSTTATVSCSGGITSLGSAGCSIESYGFVYGTSSNPTISNTKEQVGTTYTTTGTAFTKELTGLTANTTYYVRPYATNGNGTAYGTQTSFKTLELPKYTVTFDAGSGTCDDESLTETSGGAGVTLPTANPPATCATNGWKFAGWWTGSVTETTTSPGELLTAGSNYKPTSNCTLYAVYSYNEAGGSGGSSEIKLLPSSFPDKGTNNYDSGAERTATENDIEFGGHHITGNASNTPSGATQNQYLQCRASDATIYNKTELPGKITQIVVNQYDAKTFSLYCGSTQLMASDNVDRSQTPSGTKITDVSAATTMTWDVDGNYTFFALKKGSNAGYVQSIIITYSGGGSTTTYNSNPVCGTPTPTPTLNVDPATLTFENTTTNTSTQKTFTLTGSALTANAALVLSGTNEEMFSVSPTSVTPTAGSINQIVTITYKPTATGSHNATLTISSTGAESKTVTLSGTGVQQTYTITYNTNGGDVIAATSGTTLPNPLPTPTREHYTFVGWYTDESCTQAAKAGATIDADITLYAKWEATMYTVTLNPNYPAGKTGVFKDKEGNTIAGNIEVPLQSGTATQALTNFYSSIELDNYAFDGFYTQAEGGSKRVNTGDITGNITFYAHWKEKYTITWSVNGNTALIEPTTFAAGDNTWEMPTTDYDCSGKGFVGWTTNPIIAEQDEAPDPLYTNASQFPNATATYHAVFAEGGSSGGYKKLTETLDDYSGEYLIVYETDNVAFNGSLTTLDATSNYISVTINDGVIVSNTSTDAAKFTFAKVDGGYSILSASGKYIGRETTSNGLNTNSTYAAGYLNTITYNSITGKGGCTLKYNNASDQKRFRYFALGQQAIALYKKQGGGGSYSGYTTSCGAPAPTYAIIYDINGGTGTTPTQASLTEGATFELALFEGFSKEGYVFAGWNDGTTTYDAGAEYTMSATNVTFTAQWIEKSQASITLSELGATSTIDTHYIGDQYTLPNTSSQSCAGKQLVGWSTIEIAETNTKPKEKYYELGEQVTLVATQTFFAVFATVGETEERHVAGGDMYSLPTGWINNGTGIYSSHGIKFDDLNDYITSSDLGNSYTELTLKLKAGHNGGSGSVLTFYAYKEDGATLFKKDEITITPASIIPNDAYTSQTTLHEVNISASSPIRYISIWMTKDVKNLGMEYCEIFAETSNITGYTTSCVASYSITYDFAGGTDNHCSNTSVPQGDSYTICNEEPAQEGYTFQGWSDGTSTYDAGATITPSSDVTLTAVWKANTYTVTWNNNGDTDEVTYNHGDALVVPIAPASCDGVKEFVGWTTHSGYYHATTAPDDLFTTKTTPVTATATYYAVFATPPTTGGGGSIETTDDVLTRETTGVTEGSTNYASWSGKTATSSAVYAGNSAGSNNAIQLRSNNSNSGIVTTTSGGKITHVEVEWESATATDRKLDIYGRNVAYSAATDLYSTGTQGTKLGSITCGTSTELEITGDYEYIGLRSNSGAMYLTSITITWSSAGGSSSHTDYTTTCQEVTGIALSGSYPTTFIQFDAFSFAGGIVTATLENGTTQDVTELATFSGYNMDEVGVQTVTVTYMGQTAKYEITINQSDRWRLTWNVSGKTNTGASPIYVQKGNAIGELPTPEVPDACAGKTFMGWTTSNIVPSDGIGIEYITSATKPTDNTTYYAVFATINNFSIQKPIDQITSETNVVIVAVSSMDANGTAGKAISSRATDDTHNLQGDDVTIVDEHINTPHSTCIWTVEKVDGKYRFSQNGKYLNGVIDGKYSNLKYLETKDSWTLTPAASGMTMTYNMKSTNASTEYVEWYNGKFTIHDEVNNNGAFDMQFFVTANADGDADITDYTTGCAEYTITYYGFTGGYSTSSTSDGTIVLPVNSYITIPDCGDVVKDPTTLGRKFLDVWMTKPHGGHTFKPGDTFVLTQDTTLYAQWKLETTGDVITLPTDVEDLAGTDIYVYGGTTLNIQPGTTTINTLVLRGGIQSDGSYKMPTVWVPEGATLVRNNNKIYLDLVVNAENWYPFAVPFETKNTSDIHYLHPDMKSAAKYSKHFDIKTYDGARRAVVGEDRTNNWVRLKRHTAEEPVSFKPGVGYIISAMAYPGTDTATIRIPMSVPNTWFKNGEQAVVGTTVRNTIAVTAHTGEAATEHQRHAGWNFVANPYLTNFAGNNVVNDGGLNYINGAIVIEGGYTYGGDYVPYVTVPAYDFSYYEQYKLSDVKLSPEWSFFVQVETSGTMNFTTEGRQHAPATIRANSANAKQSFEANIVILNENANEADHTGLVINDRYTTAYEIGGDLEKMFGSANRTALYTLSNNIRLAYNALAWDDATQPIPLGYRAEKAGEYTIQLTNPNEIIDVESIVIKDNYNNVTTNLLISDYTFYTEQVQDDERFVIYIVPKQNTTTNLMNMVDKTETKKVIFNNHLYIIHNGCIYDGVGKTIKNK